jgi:hypothetical protein
MDLDKDNEGLAALVSGLLGGVSIAGLLLWGFVSLVGEDVRASNVGSPSGVSATAPDDPYRNGNYYVKIDGNYVRLPWNLLTARQDSY